MALATLSGRRLSGKRPTQFLLAERRTSLRFPCDLQVSYRTSGGKTGLWWNAQVRNLSLRGIALITVRSYAVGTWLTIRIQPKHGGGPLLVQAQVRHVQPDGPARWYIGCVFMHPLAASTVGPMQ